MTNHAFFCRKLHSFKLPPKAAETIFDKKINNDFKNNCEAPITSNELGKTVQYLTPDLLSWPSF